MIDRRYNPNDKMNNLRKFIVSDFENEDDEVIQTLLKIPQEVEDYCYNFFLNGFSWQSVKVFVVDKYGKDYGFAPEFLAMYSSRYL